MHIDTLHPGWLILLSVILALVPIAIGICTSYLKVSIVLGMLRSGIGAQQVPSNLLIMALSTVLSIYIMGPVLSSSLEASRSIKFSLKTLPTLPSLETWKPVLEPWEAFLMKHAGERELRVLQEISPPKSAQQSLEKRPMDLRSLLTAFILTELKEGFAMGFVLLLPFLVIDLIVSNVLAGMGMFMVSPTLISLPLKLLLFVVSDGWLLLSRSLILSYQ